MGPLRLAGPVRRTGPANLPFLFVGHHSGARVLAPDPGVLLAIGLLASFVAIIGWAIWRDVRQSEDSFATYCGFRALWLFCKLWHGVRHSGPDPLPPAGAVILVSNHTSPADPLILQSATRRVIAFLMAREYYSIRWFRPIFRLNQPILVNRTGRDTAAMRATLRALGQGRVIGIFPEGGIHLDPDSIGTAKPGTALLALLSRATVVPAYIERRAHTNRLIEGIFQPAPARIHFGHPIDLTDYYDRMHEPGVVQEVTDIFMASIDSLRLDAQE